MVKSIILPLTIGYQSIKQETDSAKTLPNSNSIARNFVVCELFQTNDYSAPMKKQDWLFDIIQAMGKNEKTFFLKYCKLFSESDTGYLILYRAMERMKDFDEKILQKKIDGKIPADRLPSTRNYLKNMLLKSLQIFNSEQSDDFILNGMLYNISFYHGKNLFSLCTKEIASAKKYVIEHELYNRFHEVARWERTVVPLTNPVETETLQHLQEIIEQEKQNFLRIETEANYHLRTIRLAKLLHRTERSLTEPIEKTQDFIAFCNDPYYTDETLANTTASKIMYCTMQFITAYEKKDMTRVELFLQRRIELMEANPDYLYNHLLTYISTLYNFIIFSSLKKDLALITSLMEKFTSIPELYKKRISRFQTEMIQVQAINAWLDFYTMTGDFERITEMKIDFPESFSKTNYNLVFYYSACQKAAAGYFALDDYKTALKFVNQVIQDSRSKSYPEILMLSRIMNLQIHYEMQNESTIEYETQSIHYFLKKNENPGKFEEEVLNFIRELLRNSSKENPGLKLIRDRIRTIASPSDDQRNFFIFTWLDAKTKGVRFMEAYLENKKQSAENSRNGF